MKLPSLHCDDCNRLIESEEYTPQTGNQAPTVTSFEDCLRKCEACGLAFSNALTNPVRIRREPFAKLPPFLSDGCEEVLLNGLNITNRDNKRRKFGFTTSEDQLTWVVFRFLQEQKRVTESFRRAIPAVFGMHTVEPTVLYWGCKVGPNGAVETWTKVREALEATMRTLGELEKLLSEPDIVLDYGAQGIVIVEVKHRSGNKANSVTPEHKWQKYLGCPDIYTNENDVIQSGLYELCRNWRIGHEVARKQGRPITLINLAPEDLFQKEFVSLQLFERGIRQTPLRSFHRLSWKHFLAPLDIPTWLKTYLSERNVV